MTNRYSQWRWGGLSGNWSISPAPKISSLKPHHLIKSTSHWPSIRLQIKWVLPRLLYHKLMKIKLSISTIITILTLHLLIWFYYICITWNMNLLQCYLTHKVHTAFIIVLSHIKILRSIECLQEKRIKFFVYIIYTFNLFFSG